jgi:RecA/RadA recombinase
MPVDETRADEIISALESRYEGTILKGDELDNPARISTGSLELDYITNGGVPQGRWSRFYGSFSSGKTRVALETIKQAQDMGMVCAYYNVEKQYTPEAAERIGINTSDLYVIEGSTVESVGEKLEAALGFCHLHVIDSCSNAISIDELNTEPENWRPGIKARTWSKMLNRAHERMDSKENTVILIDQMSKSFGLKGKPTTEEPKGGMFLGFLSSMSLKFTRGKWLMYDKNGFLTDDSKKWVRKKTVSGKDDPTGREIIVRCEKSRVGRPELAATLHFDYDKYAFDVDYEFITALKLYEMVEQHGAWWWYDDGKEIHKVAGDAGLRSLIHEHDLHEKIYDVVVNGNPG